MGTLTASWEVKGTDLVAVVQVVQPVVTTWLYKEHQLEDNKYTLLTDAGEAFHREDAYEPLLAYISGIPQHIFVHVQRLKAATANEVKSAEVHYVLKAHRGVVTVKLSLTAESVTELRTAIDQARVGLTPAIQEWTEIAPLSTTEYRNGNVSRKVSGVAESVFDSQDLAARVTGHRRTRVFISYSHDSQAHKEWVSRLVKRLNSLGVWLIFDQWDLELGGDIARFMEEGISDSDRVLVICTSTYNQKANHGVGGAGYEKMIMTGDLIKDQDTTRFIPVIRGESEPLVPRFLSSRLYVDFRNDDEFDARVFELAQALLAPGLRRPPIGASSH